MRYNRISADCHIDLPWLPPDLFTSNASATMRERVPYVAEGPEGPHWTCKNGRSYAIERQPDGHGSVLSCAILHTVAHVNCWVPLK